MAGRSAQCECSLSARNGHRFGRPCPARCFPKIAARARRETNFSCRMSRASKHASAGAQRADRNLRFGWWSLLVFLCVGAVLEALHGFKIGWYVDVGNETRRLMFTLAHAHGTLLALVNVAAGLMVRTVERFTLRPSVSFALIWAAILLPAGFFLGGIVIYDGDPGLGVWLVPIGALLLFYGIARIALDLSRRKYEYRPSYQEMWKSAGGD